MITTVIIECYEPYCCQWKWSVHPGKVSVRNLSISIPWKPETGPQSDRSHGVRKKPSSRRTKRNRAPDHPSSVPGSWRGAQPSRRSRSVRGSAQPRAALPTGRVAPGPAVTARARGCSRRAMPGAPHGGSPVTRSLYGAHGASLAPRGAAQRGANPRRLPARPPGGPRPGPVPTHRQRLMPTLEEPANQGSRM